MVRSIKIVSIMAGVLIAMTAVAQTPAAAPAGSTGMCRDGSYWSGATKKGACRGHKGVQDWYAADAAPAASGTSAVAPSAAPAATAAAPAAATSTAPAAAQKTMPMPSTTAAPGGGAGQVWVNNSSKVYHCQSDRWYGKTKNGTYMTESDAIAKGNHADHGKACK